MALRPTTLPRPRDHVRELLALLGGYRWRLGGEVCLRFAVRGLAVGALALAALAIADWLFELSLPATWLQAAIAAPPLAAAIAALTMWPSHRVAARVADRRLLLAERLGTAIELVNDGRLQGGRFDSLQIRDALERARSAPDHWPSLARSMRREAVLALGAVVLAASVALVLPGVPRPRLQATEVATPLLNPEPALEERTVPPTAAELANLEAASVAQQVADADLAPRVGQAQAEQEALDRLAQALGQVSAAQGAAEAIQRGDFPTARQQLGQLGEEADQLSDAAKKQLAQALQSAASASSTDRQLAERERQAATALSRNNYADQRNALRQLGDQVERSGQRSMPASELARDVGRLQQQQASGNRNGQSQSASNANGSTGAQGQEQGGYGLNGAHDAQGGQSTNGGDGAEQGGAGAGSGTTDGVGAPGERLATAGQQVAVPNKLGAGSAERPATGKEEEVSNRPQSGQRSVAEAVQAQQTGEVTPEQNLVPQQQRPVVRGYFQ